MVRQQAAIRPQLVVVGHARFDVERCAHERFQLSTQGLALFNEARGFGTKVGECVLAVQSRPALAQWHRPNLVGAIPKDRRIADAQGIDTPYIALDANGEGGLGVQASAVVAAMPRFYHTTRPIHIQ